MDLSQLMEFDRLAREDGRKYPQKRFLYQDIEAEKGRHFIGIAGPRGAGKTVLLKQIALSRPDTFYLSLDTFSDNLFETVKAVRDALKAGIFLLDEVHMHPGFEGELKKIYDFLDVRVIFTSSMALSMYASAHDLSRRVLIKTLYPFSLREYALFRYGRDIPSLRIEDIVEGRWDRAVTESGAFFGEYLRGGLLPFALNEASPPALLKNILQTVVFKDIARVSGASVDDLETVMKMIAFIGKSGIDGINDSSLSRNLGIGKYKVAQYAEFLERAFVLHRVMPEGTGVLREPKIVMAVPYRLLYRPYEESVGGLREDFFVEAVKSAGLDVRYLKSTRGEKTPDYVLRDRETVVFEVGGRGKGRKQFKGFKAGKKIILSDGYEARGIIRPLFTVGFLETRRPDGMAETA